MNFKFAGGVVIRGWHTYLHRYWVSTTTWCWNTQITVEYKW